MAWALRHHVADLEEALGPRLPFGLAWSLQAFGSELVEDFLCNCLTNKKS